MEAAHNMRVLHGVTSQAGQPQALVSGLRGIGIHAETCVIREHKFGYGYDRFIDLAGASDLAEVHRRIKPLIDRFDVFHFHARSFITEWPSFPYPSLVDIALLKLAGKKVFFHFRGQEIRLASLFAEKNPFHYVDERPASRLFGRLPDRSKLRLRALTTGLCDGVFVVDPELQTYVPEARIVPRALPESDWPYVGISERDQPVVMHAPSRRGTKGTDAVLRAVAELKNEGIDFEFRLVEGVPHAEAIAQYRDADIVIDQLRIGWYGVLSVEAMALGKPVIAYIREDLWRAQDRPLPIFNANPSTLKLRLRELLLSREMRRSLSLAGREYFLEVHSARKVASLLSEEYRKERPARDGAELAEFLDRQISTIPSVYKSHLPTPLRPIAAGGLRFASPVRRLVNVNAARVTHLWDTWRDHGGASAYALVKRFLLRQSKAEN